MKVEVGTLLRLRSASAAGAAISAYDIPPSDDVHEVQLGELLLVLGLHEAGKDLHNTGWTKGARIARVLICGKVKYIWVGHVDQPNHTPWWFEEVAREVG